jgi:hypothetical protein
MKTIQSTLVFSHLTPVFLGGINSIISFNIISSLALTPDGYRANVHITGMTDFTGSCLSTDLLVLQRIRGHQAAGSIPLAAGGASNQVILGTTLKP